MPNLSDTQRSRAQVHHANLSRPVLLGRAAGCRPDRREGGHGASERRGDLRPNRWCSTLNPEPETLNSKLETRNPNPEPGPAGFVEGQLCDGGSCVAGTGLYACEKVGGPSHFSILRLEARTTCSFDQIVGARDNSLSPGPLLSLHPGAPCPSIRDAQHCCLHSAISSRGRSGAWCSTINSTEPSGAWSPSQ